MCNIQDPSGSGRSRVATRWGLGAVLCVTVFSVAHGQTGEVLSVQPATVQDGAVEVYGIIRELGEHPNEDGTGLAVQVTAADSNASTPLRLEADGKPCPDCTTTHYFLVREPGDEEPEMLARTAPGPVTYLHLDGKEYMVADVALSWTDGRPRLERATLWQTGFAPPILKRKVRIRFDAPLNSGPLADDVAGMAMRDAMEQGRRAQRAYEEAVRQHEQGER